MTRPRQSSTPERSLARLAEDVQMMENALKQIAQGYCYVGSTRKDLDESAMRVTAKLVLIALDYIPTEGADA